VIKRNATTVKAGSWNSSSESINVSVDGLRFGVYNFTIIVYDSRSMSASDMVIVTVGDATPPTINHPTDITITHGEEGRIITWNPSDANPDSYQILRNGTIIDSDDWSGSNIFISLDELGIATWNYTLVVIDLGGNTVSDTVMVTVTAAVITTTTTITTTPPDTTTTATTTTSTTTTTTMQPTDGYDPMLILAFSGGIGLIVFLMVIYLSRHKSKDKGKDEPKEMEEAVIGSDLRVQALRGGEFVGNRFRYKVKVLNKSPYVITDVTVTLMTYPRDSLKLEVESVKTIAKIDPEGFRSPTFEFLPTQDCVKGDLIATVSYVDSLGKAYSVTTETYKIRAVCDLLSPERITPEDFMLKLATLGHGEMTTRVEEWTPEEMQTKTLQILESSNFFKVTSETNAISDHVEFKIAGWAKGIYTGKNLGVQIVITGKPGLRGATCKVRMSGEDEAMIMPAIDEINQKLSAWLCPMCGGKLPAEMVDKLKEGESIACPFCGVTLNR
jgi:hypothetical protein